MATNVQRPLEWMRFDPVEFMHLVDGLTLEEVGAATKLMLKLWQFGPMSEADVRKVCKAHSEAVMDLLCDVDGLLSYEFVETARTYGKVRQAQRVEAGKASAAKRNDRSTDVQRPFNDRSTDVLSMSVSESSSFSSSISQSKKERVREAEIWPTFQNFWDAYEKKGNRKTAEAEWAKLPQADREAIMVNVPRYNASKPDKQFRKDGERYLKLRAWEDAIVERTTPQANGQPTAEQRSANYERILAERYPTW